MVEHYSSWFSTALDQDFEMLVFGDRGSPLILFPTSMGRYYQNKDFGLIDSIGWFIDNGFIKVYCPDSRDSESWYNRSIAPYDRVQAHLRYERMVLAEIVPRAQYETNQPKLILGGCSFGGYHAANMAFKYPELVSGLLALGGVFDIRSQLDGFYDDSVYFNNPKDYVPGLSGSRLSSLEIVLGSGEFDPCLGGTQEMSEILAAKGLNYWFDVRPGAAHDWPVWREQLPRYLSSLQ